MAQFRPFAIKTGANVPSGTTQYQNILVGVAEQNYNNLEYDWVAGPDESLGHVIAFHDADGDTFRGARIGITNCEIGFLRSKLLTDNSFLELVNYMRAKVSESAVNNTSTAKSWLISNGYWTSFGETPWAYGNQEETGGSGFTITIDQVGSDIVMTATGTLNINDLTLVATNNGPFGGGGMGINTATWAMGSTPAYYDEYSGFTSVPSNFGTGMNGFGSTSSSGDILGVIYQGAPPHHLVVPVGYNTGDQITSTQTFANQTLTGVGFVDGTYTYTWGTGANAYSINVIVGSGAGGGGNGGGNTGAGWLFYSDEGGLNATPPQSNGNAIFVVNGNETFNPNAENGKMIYFNRLDSEGTDYGTQFNNLMTNGGSISITQNGHTVIYASSTPYEFQYNSASNGFLMINTTTVDQTQTVTSPFVYGDPITLTFN